MAAAVSYPFRVGKHIVCIYASPLARRLYKHAWRGQAPPRPHLPTGKEVSDIDKSKRKDKMVAMRFSRSDHAVIRLKADKAKMNFTEFVTAAALGKPIVIIDGIDEVLKEQKAAGRNLNQMTTLCNMGKIHTPDLEEVKTGFSIITDKLSELLQRSG